VIASIRTLCNLFCLLTADISRVTIKSTAFYRVGSRKMNSSAKVYPMYLCPKVPLHFWSTSSTLLFPTWVNQKSGSLLSQTQETSTPNPFPSNSHNGTHSSPFSGSPPYHSVLHFHTHNLLLDYPRVHTKSSRSVDPIIQSTFPQDTITHVGK